MPTEGPHVLIIVQNLPVPLDRRVWLECTALVGAGYQVSVICPKGPNDPTRSVIDGVHIYKYRPAPAARGLPGFVVEFTYSWLRTAWLSTRVWRRRPFQVLQACNPPDTYWALAWLWRCSQVAFVFDQHDLNPELFVSRFGQPATTRQRAELWGLRWLERMTYRTAHRVISTNESYRRKALTRGGHRPDTVTVVRSGPDTRQMRPIYPQPGIRADGSYLLVYLGIMGPQDGVQTVLDVMRDLVFERGRTDVRAALLGFGDCLDELRQRCTELGLDPWVTFTGRADRRMIAEYLSAADVGLCPDPKTPLNDISTMNKTMEYMAHALPSVSFDLVETRVSGGESVLYIAPGDVRAFATAVVRLLDDPDMRVTMGLAARRRVEQELDWRPQARQYVAVFDELLGIADRGTAETDEPDASSLPSFDPDDRLVNLDDPAELAEFILHRGRERAVSSVARGRR